jgi:hypothetical protein
MVFRERRPARHRAPDGTVPACPRTPEGLEVTAAEVTAELGSLFDDSFFDSVEPLPARPAPAPGTPDDAQGPTSPEPLRLRLPAPYAEQLQELAEQRGVTPGALLATWVMERLATEGRPTMPAPDGKPSSAPPSVAPAQRSNPDAPPAESSAEPGSAEPRQPATASWDLGLPEDLVSLLSPVDHLNPIGDLAPPSPAAVTPLFRGPPPAHASEEPPKGPRHRAPEPVINLHSRRKI